MIAAASFMFGAVFGALVVVIAWHDTRRRDANLVDSVDAALRRSRLRASREQEP